ncbi:MAG: hypothetical protein WB919_12390 [Candidatus Sulfotelmatobacter sp.]
MRNNPFTLRTFHVCISAWLLALTLSASAQQTAPPPPSQAELNQQLLQRIQELEKEVQALKAQPQAPAVAAAAPAPAPPPEPVAEPPVVNEVAPRLKLNFFGDVGYQTGQYFVPNSSFELDEFDMFATARLSDKVSALGEILFTSNSDNSVGVDVERLYLKYRQSDYLAATIGRIHTDIGYYNTAFNRGDYFQTAVGRPTLFEFDDQGGFLPLQDLGVVLDGKVPSGMLGLNYVFEVTNGREYGINVNPSQNNADTNNSKAVNFNISAKPERVSGLDVGFSIRHDYLSDVNYLHVSEIIPMVYVVFTNSKYEFLNEGTIIRHTLPAGPVFHTTAFYSQFSRGFGAYRPYFRYDYVNAPLNDPIYGNPTEIAVVGRVNGPTVGLRWDFTAHTAAKLQYTREASDFEKPANGAAAQFDFTF